MIFLLNFQVKMLLCLAQVPTVPGQLPTGVDITEPPTKALLIAMVMDMLINSAHIVEHWVPKLLF